MNFFLPFVGSQGIYDQFAKGLKTSLVAFPVFLPWIDLNRATKSEISIQYTSDGHTPAGFTVAVE